MSIKSDASQCHDLIDTDRPKQATTPERRNGVMGGARFHSIGKAGEAGDSHMGCGGEGGGAGGGGGGGVCAGERGGGRGSVLLRTAHLPILRARFIGQTHAALSHAL